MAAFSIAASLFAGGCSSRPALLQPEAESTASFLTSGDVLEAPPPAVGRDFFPLEVGNEWNYQGRSSIRVVPTEGEPPPPIWSDFHAQTALVCVEATGGPSYVVAREVFDLGGDVSTSWIRLRQDQNGLYESDVVSGPPACVPSETAIEPARRPVSIAEALATAEPRLGASYVEAYERLMDKVEMIRRFARTSSSRTVAPEAVLDGEITRLAYPMHVGQHWSIRSDPLFTSQVVAHERLVLPAGVMYGFKVRIDSELFGPNDQVSFWMSRTGFLAWNIHVEGEARDDSGNLIGLVFYDERRELADFHLRGLGGRGGPHSVFEPEVSRME